MTTESTPFNLRKKTDQVLAVMRPQIHAKGLAFKVDWPTDIPDEVIGDPTRYQQIITNLLGNALKFTASGEIALRARTLSAQNSSVLLRFEIEDTGIGIKREVLSKLFESFTQADNSTTREYGGTGLGLAIVKRLAQLLGGSCGVSSEYGKGSCFWFTLSFERTANAGVESTDAVVVEATKASANRLKQGLNVLVVEDNIVNQTVARRLLEVLGCKVGILDDGQKAVSALTAPHEFELVLMDCQMPVMGGIEATRLIRDSERANGSRIPIIALTANSMRGDREQCLEAGMDDFLSKPFQLRDLSAILDAWAPQTA